VTHDEAVSADLADKYVNGRLAGVEREAFEAHLFECTACFADVAAVERLRAGVRHLVQNGEWPEETAVPALPVARAPRWMPWLAAVAAIVVAVGAAGLVQRQRSLSDQIARQQQEIGSLQAVLADARAPRAPAVAAEGNVPVAILQTTRAANDVTTLTIAGASRFIVWLDDAPLGDGEAGDLTIEDASGRVVARIGNLHRNSQNAAVAAFPSDTLTPGRFTLRLRVGQDERATYHLDVSR
jgi:hypothetical protein